MTATTLSALAARLGLTRDGLEESLEAAQAMETTGHDET